MKNIFYILLSVFLFTACSSDNDNGTETAFVDWNDPNDSHYSQYQGKYNPIAGEWQLYEQNGSEYSDFYVAKFSDSRTMSVSTVKPDDDEDLSYGSSAAYKINDKSLQISGLVYTYSISNGVLTLTYSGNVFKYKAYVSTKWEWDGDWNDPSDPHYAQYQGKYNPIIGVWDLTHIDGEPTLSTGVETFSDNFQWTDGRNTINTKYIINGTGIRMIDKNSIYKYKIEDNKTLILQLMLPNKGVPLTYKRVK
ncbi:hypothetical protein [Dysgonomonas macrotermitis]|nr:hypothetical protein [Dysgonomonas macrotermitis]